MNHLIGIDNLYYQAYVAFLSKQANQSCVFTGLTMKNILFLCVANSDRSQIAEGLADKDVTIVSGYKRVPAPPAKIIPFILSPLLINECINCDNHWIV